MYPLSARNGGTELYGMCADEVNLFGKGNLQVAGTYANANVGRCTTSLCNAAGRANAAPRALAAALAVVAALVVAASNF